MKPRWQTTRQAHAKPRGGTITSKSKYRLNSGELEKSQKQQQCNIWKREELLLKDELLHKGNAMLLSDLCVGMHDSGRVK